LLDLASRLRDLPSRRGDPPWPGHEYIEGWGVFGLPFESGHVLALMSETMPSGHVGILMPQRMYFIDQATTVDDEDLGHAVRVSPNPQIGQVPLPACGVLAVGQAAWAILDNNERALTPREVTERPGG